MKFRIIILFLLGIIFLIGCVDVSTISTPSKLEFLEVQLLTSFPNPTINLIERTKTVPTNIITPSQPIATKTITEEISGNIIISPNPEYTPTNEIVLNTPEIIQIDIPISIDNYATSNISDRFPDFQPGNQIIGGVRFSIPENNNQIVTRCANQLGLDNQYTIPINYITHPENIYLLINSENTQGYQDANLGKIELGFTDKSVLSYDLIHEINIFDGRDENIWDIDTPNVTINSEILDSISGIDVDGNSIQISLLRLAIPEEYKNGVLESITIEDLSPKNEGSEYPCISISGITVRRYETQQKIQLTDSIGDNVQPSFSPDGNSIVFISSRDGNQELYIMSFNGENQIRLTKTDNIIEDRPTISPTGNKIVFGGNNGANEEIFSIELDGSNYTNLSNSPNSDDGRPIIKPGVFTTIGILFDSNRNGNWEIYSSTNIDNMANAERIVSRPEYIDRLPTYIPITEEVLFRSEKDSISSIYLFNTLTETLTKLSNNETIGYSDFYPTTNTSGDWIIFVSNRDGNYEIYAMKKDGTNIQRLTYTDYEENTPALSPDSKWIVFSQRDATSGYEIYKMPFNP